MGSHRQVNQEKVESSIRMLLEAIGEDPDRPGLVDTPKRVARSWSEFIDFEPGTTDSLFTHDGDGMVVVSGMRVWSLCEHHLLPFWCDISVGYIPTGQVLGLSKFARVAQQFAHRLQIQERLAKQVCDQISFLTGSPDVAVIARGRHLCMAMRGIRTEGVMTSSVMTGRFRDDHNTRAEFLRLSEAK